MRVRAACGRAVERCDADADDDAVVAAMAVTASSPAVCGCVGWPAASCSKWDDRSGRSQRGAQDKTSVRAHAHP